MLEIGPTGHAAVLRVDNHSNAVRFEMRPDAIGHLRSQSFLYLQPARIAVKHAGKLGDADDAVPGKVSDRGRADDRRHVMFAV